MAGELSEKKRISLGTKPITLRSFRSNGASHVFAASDRPTVLYSSNKKLLYSNLNEDEVCACHVAYSIARSCQVVSVYRPARLSSRDVSTTLQTCCACCHR